MAEPGPAAQAGNLLEVRDLSLSFGGLTVLDEVSLDVPEGSITAIIGPNGAGKSSLFNSISGSYRPQAGTITFAGHRPGIADRAEGDAARRALAGPRAAAPGRDLRRHRAHQPRAPRLHAVLVEQNTVLALEVARYGYVMEQGRVVLEGPVETLKANRELSEAYLGSGKG